MAKYVGKVWECENCGTWVKHKPWNCLVCGKEVCEACFDSYMICCECAKGKTIEELKTISEKLGYVWDE